MAFLRALSRLLIGLLFIFSGFTKAIDPVGSGFIFAEYFHAFGLDFLIPLSTIGGVLLSAFEFIIGVSVLVGLRMRLTATLAMIFMVFFTVFTLGTAIFHPVAHCGCFGDAIHMSSWTTFLKNLIFTPFAIFLFSQRKRFVPVAPKYWEWGTMVLFGVVSLVLSLYCYRHLPIIDFTGFKVGNNIPEAMSLPEDAPKTEYKTTFYYQKDGQTQAFDADKLPDSSWTFVNSKTKILKVGAIPDIPSFFVTDYKSGQYVTDSMLAIQGPLLVLSLPYADKAKEKAFASLALLSAQLDSLHIPLVVFSGSSAQATSSLLDTYGITAPAYFSDAKTLYTVVRSNPGLMLMDGATVIAKWSAYEFPSLVQLQKILGQDSEILTAKSSIIEQLSMEFFLAVLLLFLAAIRFVFRLTYKHKPFHHVDLPSEPEKI